MKIIETKLESSKSKEVANFVALPQENLELLFNLITTREELILEKINSLEYRLSDLENKQIIQEPLNVIIIEQMSKEEAKRKVLEFIQRNKTTDISELHKFIKCDISILIEVIDELKNDGKIGD